MAVAKLISPVTKQNIGKTRVAAYCRVSSNSADQEHSYATQVRVYTKMIHDRQDWELVDIFADEGLSGMKAENRTEFQRMIRMCEHREIDLIITKSVSRFARNVKESLSYARKLKRIGVGIQFEKEGINTLALGDEMLLATFSAIAQEESQAISQNQRLANVKRMERGEYIATNAPYGFRLVDKKLEVYEPEAAVVHSIFQLYLSGWSTHEIARELTQQQIPTKYGKTRWKSDKVAYILANERYMGDSLYQKTFRETTVPFKAHKNRGEADMYYAAHTHAPLIDEETFKKAQELLNKRKEQFLRTETQTIYPLTSRIRCAECGSTFRRKVREENIKWVCSRHEREANACRSFYYSEDRIYDGIIRILNKLRFDENILGQVSAKLDCAVERYKRNNLSAREKSQSIAELNGRILMLDQLRAKGYLALDVYHSQVRELQNQLKRLKEERKSDMDTRLLGMQDEVRKLQMILQGIDKPLERFDENLFREIVQDIEIDKTDRMTVTVLGGLKFSEII